MANSDVVRLTYNCDPESLADIGQEAFVDAFEAACARKFPRADVTVTFKPAPRSELVSVAGADLPDDPVQYFGETVKALADEAFYVCGCQNIQ